MEVVSIFEMLYSNLPPTWSDFFKDQCVQDAVAKASSVIESDIAAGLVVCPTNPHHIFRIFYEVPFNAIQVVILGLDPYHTPTDAATGIAFSIPKSHTYINPSVSNIKKVAKMCGFNQRPDGNLEHWVSRGVFLVNAALTTLHKKPRAHLQIWSKFTAQLIQYISKHKKNIVFIMWGRDADVYSDHIINKVDHCIIRSSHPSGLSAYTPYKNHPCFMKSMCFTKSNEYLISNGIKRVDFGT